MHHKITIPNPCSQSWDEMTPQKDGRFCGACEKTVVDFTTWHDEKIVAYLLQHPGTCGRYRENSLEHPIIYVPERKNTSILKRWMMIAAIPLFVQVAYAQNTGITNHIPPTEQYSAREMPEVAAFTGNGEPLTLLITTGKEAIPAATALVQVYRNHVLIFHGTTDTSGKIIITRDLQSADEIRITYEEVYRTTYIYAEIQKYHTKDNTYAVCAYDRKNPPPQAETGILLGRSNAVIFIDGIKIRDRNTPPPAKVKIQSEYFPVIPEGHKPAELE